MKTKNRFSFANHLSRNKLMFWLLMVFYAFIILTFFRSVLTTWPTVVYTVVIFAVLIVVLIRVYSFMNTFTSEVGVIGDLSSNIEPLMKDLKGLGDNSSSAVTPDSYLESVRETLRAYHKSSSNTLVASVACVTLLRYRSRTKLEISEIMAESFDASTKGIQTVLNAGASMSIAIGLLGTFAGMLHSLGNNITISKLILGLHEAIGSSIVGVLTAIFILAFSKLYTTREAELRERVSQFLMWGLFPAFQVETTVMINEETARIIGQRIGEVLAKHLQGVFQQLAEAIERLTVGISSLLQRLIEHNEKLNKLVTDLHEAIGKWNQMIININQTFGEMRDSLKGLSKELQQNKEIVQGANDELIQVLNKLEKTSEILQGDLKLWVKKNPAVQISDHILTIKESADKLYGIISNLDNTITRHMDKFIEQTAEHWLPMEKSMSGHRGALDRFTEKVGAVENNFTSISTRLDDLKKQLELITSQLDESESVTRKMARIQDRVDKKVQKEYEQMLKDGRLRIQNGRIVISK